MLLLLLLLTVQYTQSSNNVVFSYYYGSQQGLKPWEQPGNQLTHVLFSFANILMDGTVTLHGPSHTTAGIQAYDKATLQTLGYMDVGECRCSPCLKGELYQMHLLKRKYPHLKTILSVGGWTWSDNFSVAFNTQSSRKRAIDSAQLLMQEFGFDGLDIDWEFPGTQKSVAEYKFWQSSPLDWSNLAMFLTEARDTFKSKYLLTAATPGYIFNGSKETWTMIGSVLDYVLVMGYEYHHGQDRTWAGSTFMSGTGDTAVEASNTVVEGLKTYREKGVPSTKIVLGVPMYATGYKGFTSKPDLGLSTAGLTVLEPTAYNTLVQSVFKEYKYTQKVDLDRGVAVWTNSSHMYLMESPETVRMKSEFIKTHQYAGIMFWNSAQDLLDPQLSLLNAAALVLQVDTTGRHELWCVDDSPWCNLKCGFDERTLKTTVMSSGAAAKGTCFGWVVSFVVVVVVVLSI